jgi:molecular chaperone GrpE (heat shock protein)
MTPEDRTLDGATVDEVARGGAAEASSGEAAQAETAPAADAPPDENVYHKALDAYMNGDLTGVVKLVDGVLEQQPAAGLKSRLERLRRRATDRLTREKVDAPAEPEAAAPEAAAPEAAAPEAVEAPPAETTESAESAPAEPAATETAPAEPAVTEPEPAPSTTEASAPAVEAPPADTTTSEPPTSEPPKVEAVTSPATTEAAPEATSTTAEQAPSAVTKADTPVPAERTAPRPARPARPAGAPAAGAPTAARPPSGAPAARPGVVSKPVATAPVAGARPRQAGSGSHPALNAPPGAGALKAELDRVAGELDRLRKVVSGVEEHIVKVAEAYGKLAKDGKRKDQAYDQLYEELRQYKDNFLKSAQKPLFLDVILLFDGINRTINQFADLPDEKVTRQMVVDALSHTRDEIIELLYRRDIEKISDTPKKLDVTIQKPVTRIETDNADEDRDIVQVVREGFRWSGVVLRAQEVVVKRSTKEREPQ